MKPFCYLPLNALGRLVFWTLTWGLLACEGDPNADVADISLQVDVERTDSLLWACARDLQAGTDDPMAVYQRHLATEREFLMTWVDGRPEAMNLPPAQQDSLIARMLLPVLADSSVYALLDTIRKEIPYDFPLEERLVYPLKRLKKYFPQSEIPYIRTHADGYVPYGDVSSVDQVMYLPGYFSFGLHYFMGPDFPYYPQNVPKFVRKRFDTTYLEVAMAQELAVAYVRPPALSYQLRLLDHIMYAGIKQEFVDQLLPNTPDSLKLFYSQEQMEWANYFEANIYNELLNDDFYSTDVNLYQKYLADKPRSTHLSIESAPRLGVFVGWKIVQAYREQHPELSLEALCSTNDYEQIFREARYKP